MRFLSLGLNFFFYFFIQSQQAQNDPYILICDLIQIWASKNWKHQNVVLQKLEVKRQDLGNF